MRIAFYTLGCKVNQYETEYMKELFVKEGFCVVAPTEFAEVYVINSCTVTEVGDKKTRQIMRRFAKQNPAGIIALTGCMPQAFPEKAKDFLEATIVTGAKNRADLLTYVKQALQHKQRIVQIEKHQKQEPFEAMHTSNFSDKTRAFVKIQDGCDKHCTYCIIPKARGFVRSKSLEDLGRELQSFAQNGYREVVLSGVNLSSYGKGMGLRLVDAVQAACAVDGIFRVRLGSLEPDLLLDSDIALLQTLPKFCPQFHLSLQSGCDTTLRRMGRLYDTKLYHTLVDKLRKSFVNPAITTDIMVGFPGETELEFQETSQFAEQIQFAKIHIFSYSKREGTPAASFADQVAPTQKASRHAELQAIEEKSRIHYWNSFVGKSIEVLWESAKEDGSLVGHSKTFVPVFGVAENHTVGQTESVVVTGVSPHGCFLS